MATGETVLTETDEEQEDQENEEIIIVEEPPVEEDEYDVSETDAAVKEDSEAVPRQELEADEDKERDVIRQRRRREKTERKERRDAAIKRDKTELDFLRGRNENLERRLSAQEQKSQQHDITNIDQALVQASKEVQMSERVIAKAVEQNNGQDVTQAMKYRDQAMQKVQQLQYNKQTAARTLENPPVDDQTMHYAQEFIADNPWYDAQGRDEDSAIVLAIDQGLAKDGYNPQTEEYWDELRTRASRRLPERFEEGDNKSASKARTSKRVARGGPAVGSGREHAPASTRQEVYISPERKQALIEAGVWDDPVLRNRYVKSYAQYDKENV